MNLIMSSSIIAILAPSAIILVAWLLNTRSNMDREKSSPFECGFDPKSTARIPFSMRFFLLAIIFIVFDIEIVLLMPVPTIILTNSPYTTLITTFSFLVILLLGLIHEWKEGSLDWSS